MEYLSGKPKPLFAAWPLPLTVSRSHGGYSLWGLVRPATGATKVTVLVQRKGSHAWRVLETVSTNSHGYWALSSHTAGGAWRVRWKSPQGKSYEGPPVHAY